MKTVANALKKGYTATYGVIIYDDKEMESGVFRTYKAEHMEELSKKVNTKKLWKVISRQ